ncbi:MAG: glycosyltransferase family 4 protein [Phenylobacterium sp.]|nr:glycosyltransferase family 4 protein [Phenylobacterium sp.]
MARVLVFSTLYPNATQPNHGVFVENRLLETLALGGLEATVIAPVPYFPSAHPRFGRYAAFARAPKHEVRNGVEVWHPRYLVIPKVGSGWTPGFLYHSALRAARRLQAQGKAFDLIDAHYFYPDGVAAALLGQKLRLPVVITGRGTDLTLVPNDAGARAQIVWAAQEASANLAVCDDLRRRLIALGAPEERTMVLRNGVNLELFRPGDRVAARAALDLAGFVVLSVGSLIPRKGHALTIEALRRWPDCTLLIAGDGPLRAELQHLARRLGVAERVRFLGDVPHAELPSLYNAADAMVLASDREGWANVLLESMACGTPVVATDVNGAAEVVRSRAAGLLVRMRTPDALARALDRLRQAPPSRDATRRYAEDFGWAQVAAANRALFDAVARSGYEHRHSVENVRGAQRHLTAALERAI